MEDNNMVEEKKPEEVKKEEHLTIVKVKEMLDERFAEEKEALVATVVEEVKTGLKKEAETSEKKVEDAFEEKTEDGEEPNKGEESEEDKEEEIKNSVEESEEVDLSVSVIDEDKLVDSITERILDSIGEKREEEIKDSVEGKEVKLDEDKLVDSITERILDSIGEKRDVSDTKTEAALKESVDASEEDKPFTSEEAAKLIINDMNRKDPLARAINEARNL
jgi:hypothetical protein